VSPREAAAFYEHGISVNLEGFDSAVPEVSAVLDRLAEELGIPRKYCFCSAFVSPKGSGLPLHFDSKDVVVLQVAGRKRWTVAQNSSISDPVVNHTAGGAYSSRHMRQYAEEVASVTPPEELQIVDMRPGSTLYLPRGYWHGTNADEESISLSFGFAAPSWAAVFVDRLQDALLLSDHWRAPAVRMSSAPAEFVPSAIAELMQAATADILGGALSNAIRDLVESSRGLSSIRPSKGQHPITTAPPAEPHPLEESHVPATNH
jgi:ribosomal protein L16 Arg81 hydroxylase